MGVVGDGVDIDYHVTITVAGVAQWLERRSLTGGLSLIYA